MRTVNMTKPVYVTNFRTAPAADAKPGSRDSQRFLLRQDRNIGGCDTLDILHLTLIEGRQGPYHLHHKSDNFMICLSGTVETIVDEVRYLLSEGDTIFIPAGVGHSVGNGGDAPSEALEMYAPPRTESVPLGTPASVRDAPKAGRG
jgi:mannose-6-phosphate isomerase-like protein (cupin superfamily)